MKKSILYTCLLGLGTLAVSSCSDPMEEIEHIIYGRVFSPTDLEVKNVKESEAELYWNAQEGAAKYLVEIFEDDSLTFAGEPFEVQEITEPRTTFVVLTYDTDYSVRVTALDGSDASRNSKPSTIYFRTSAQQILNSIKEENIADRSITLTWPANEKKVSVIEILDEAGNVVATHNITAEEIEAAKATVTGISPETKYTARLYYINPAGIKKQRGTKTFTTIADLNGAILLHPEDNIQKLVEEAEDGTVFALYGGKYVVKGADEGSVGSIKVSKDITIKGIFPTKMPTLNGRFEINNGATLTIQQVNIDGTGTSGDQCFNFKGTQVGGLLVENSSIMNFVKGVHYVNVEAKVPYIKYVKCIIANITCDGGDMFDCRKGCIEDFTLSQSTIYASCAARDFIRYDDNSAAFPGATSVITVDKCTIDGAANGGKRLLYVRYGGKNDPKSTSINWTNNIVTNTGAVWSNQATTPVANFGNNNVYFGCAKLNVLDGADGGKTNLFIDESRTEANPQYKDAAKGDFTVGNESVSKLKVGDPRWY